MNAAQLDQLDEVLTDMNNSWRGRDVNIHVAGNMFWKERLLLGARVQNIELTQWSLEPARGYFLVDLPQGGNGERIGDWCLMAGLAYSTGDYDSVVNDDRLMDFREMQSEVPLHRIDWVEVLDPRSAYPVRIKFDPWNGWRKNEQGVYEKH